MQILLLDVHYEKTRKPLHVASITLGELAALTPKKHSLEFQNIVKPTKINYESDYDIIGISTITPSAPFAYNIADNFRKSGKIVVLGGYHPTVLPTEAKQHADSVVIGEGEFVWPQLLEDFEQGKLKSFYENKEPVDPKFIPNPIRRKNKKYGHPTIVQATRGCPYGCEFCSIYHKKFGHIFRKKPIEKVIEDIKSTNGKFFFFADPSLTIDVNYTKQLFKEMKELNKKFNCFGNMDVLAKDEELLKLSSEAGCVLWHVGIESINPESLKIMKKETNKIEEYHTAIRNINDQGMNVFGEFVFGFDTDTPEIFEKTEEMINDWNMIPGFQILVPYPGSPLFDKFDKEGRILTKDWSEYTINNVVFQPKNMTPDFLRNEVKNLYKNFYSFYPTMKRIITSTRFGFYPFISSVNTNFSVAKRHT